MAGIVATTESYKRWRRKNAQKLNTQARARYAKNGDALRKKAAIRRAANRDKFVQTSRRFRENHPNAARDYYRRDPVKRLLECAKKRAAARGMDYNLTRADVTIPPLCPVLNIPLVIGGGRGMRDSSPTLDRRDNALGYVRGNVFVISYRANRLKSDAQVWEVRAVLKYCLGETSG